MVEKQYQPAAGDSCWYSCICENGCADLWKAQVLEVIGPSAVIKRDSSPYYSPGRVFCSVADLFPTEREALLYLVSQYPEDGLGGQYQKRADELAETEEDSTEVEQPGLPEASFDRFYIRHPCEVLISSDEFEEIEIRVVNTVSRAKAMQKFKEFIRWIRQAPDDSWTDDKPV